MALERRLRWAPLWWALAVGVTIYVVVECLLPPKLVPDLHVSDKLEHAGAFGLLTILYCGVTARRAYPLVFVAMLALGGGIELAQGAMGLGRDMDIKDFFADSLGVFAAAVAAYVGFGSWPAYIERRLGIS